MKKATLALVVLVVSLMLISPLFAASQSAAMEESLPAVGDLRVAQPPLRLAERSTSPSIALAAALEAAPGELDDIASWNRARNEPTKVGFSRALPEALWVDLAAGAPDPTLRSGEAVPHAGGLLSRTGAGELVWGARIEVADAHRLRLRLTEVELPAGTQMWVYGGGELVAFGLELLSDRERSLWTPSIGGGVLHLEVRVPPGLGEAGVAGSFEVGEVAEIFRLDREGRPLTAVTAAPSHDASCLVDAQCVTSSTFDVIDGVQQAIAHLQFMVGSSVAVCTGGLLNDTVQGTTVPLFQTANHCLSTQSVANTSRPSGTTTRRRAGRSGRTLAPCRAATAARFWQPGSPATSPCCGSTPSRRTGRSSVGTRVPGWCRTAPSCIVSRTLSASPRPTPGLRSTSTRRPAPGSPVPAFSTSRESRAAPSAAARDRRSCCRVV